MEDKPDVQRVPLGKVVLSQLSLATVMIVAGGVGLYLGNTTVGVMFVGFGLVWFWVVPMTQALSVTLKHNAVELKMVSETIRATAQQIDFRKRPWRIYAVVTTDGEFTRRQKVNLWSWGTPGRGQLLNSLRQFHYLK